MDRPAKLSELGRLGVELLGRQLGGPIVKPEAALPREPMLSRHRRPREEPLSLGELCPPQACPRRVAGSGKLVSPGEEEERPIPPPAGAMPGYRVRSGEGDSPAQGPAKVHPFSP